MIKEDKSKFERKQERRIKQTWATIFLLGATLMVFLVVYGWQIKDVGANGQAEKLCLFALIKLLVCVCMIMYKNIGRTKLNS